nr:hypothetical protein [Tanacetum cinerariifolium]
MPRGFCIVKRFVVLFYEYYMTTLKRPVSHFQADGCWEGQISVGLGVRGLEARSVNDRHRSPASRLLQIPCRRQLPVSCPKTVGAGLLANPFFSHRSGAGLLANPFFSHRSGEWQTPFASKPAPTDCRASLQWLIKNVALIQTVDLHAQLHVVAALRGVATDHAALIRARLVADPGQRDPLTESAADLGVGALHLDRVRLLLAHAVVIGADAQVNNVARHGRGHVKALGHIAVLRVGLRVTITIGLHRGDGNALTHLNQRRGAFIGLHLLYATVAADRVVVLNARLTVRTEASVLRTHGAIDRVTLIVLHRAVAGVDADHQSLGGGVELAEQLAQFADLVGLGVDDQLVAVGVDAAVVAQKGLHRRQQVIAGAVVQRNDFGGGRGRKAAGQQQ